MEGIKKEKGKASGIERSAEMLAIIHITNSSAFVGFRFCLLSDVWLDCSI